MNRLAGLSAAIKRRPLRVAIVVTAGKAAAADLMVQALVERKEKIDLRRTALFGAFGGIYQGMFQYGCVPPPLLLLPELSFATSSHLPARAAG